MHGEKNGGLTEKDRAYIDGLRSVARFGWLVHVFEVMLVLNIAATVYFVVSIYFDREVVIWQSVSQCLSLLFFIIYFREKLVAHRVISRLDDGGGRGDGEPES